jgi:large subunit ribosomal protein L35
MPKLRTHKATAKRFKVTRTGAVLRPHAQKSHLLSHKSARRKRQYQKLVELRARDAVHVRRAAPYL